MMYVLRSAIVDPIRHRYELIERRNYLLAHGREERVEASRQARANDGYMVGVAPDFRAKGVVDLGGLFISVSSSQEMSLCI